MGYPMAINLKNKLPDEDMVICDLNRDAVDAFVNETQGMGKGKVKVVETAAEVVLGTVRRNKIPLKSRNALRSSNRRSSLPSCLRQML